MAMEGALKLKEVNCLPAEGYSASELRQITCNSDNGSWPVMINSHSAPAGQLRLGGLPG